MPGGEALRRAGLQPMRPRGQGRSCAAERNAGNDGRGRLAVARGLRVVRLADLAGAMSLEALMGTPAAFDPRIHQARPHAGQIRRGGASARVAGGL
jgi:histidine ammonia-lyase